ncbi:MAG: DUF3846 domain-containing protein [Peptostreptococcaceae bacterium]|nr:DUF3846 domain-containing protein [Peptostreptococcaceae bacterium]
MKKEELIKSVIIRDNTLELKVIENTLHTFQEIVGGLIEVPFVSHKLYEKGIDIIINEEGKLLDLKPSMVVMNEGKIIDIIHGNVIFTSYDNYGNQKSLTQEQTDYILELVNKRVKFELGEERKKLDCGIIEC